MANPEKYQYLVDTSAAQLGLALRRHRQALGASLEKISNRLDYAFTPVVLSMIESGQYPLEEPQVHLLLWGYDAHLDELLPALEELEFDEQPAVGRTIRELKESTGAVDLLDAYLTFVYDLRDAPQGSPVPLRQADLVVLSNTIDWPTDEIRGHLLAVMGKGRVTSGRPSETAELAGVLAGRDSVRDTCEVGTVTTAD